MAQQQVTNLTSEKFKQFDLTISDHILVSIFPDGLLLKQKDSSGKSKTCSISKSNWFQLMGFAEIIESCFIIKNHERYLNTRFSTSCDVLTDVKETLEAASKEEKKKRKTQVPIS